MSFLFLICNFHDLAFLIAGLTLLSILVKAYIEISGAGRQSSINGSTSGSVGSPRSPTNSSQSPTESRKMSKDVNRRFKSKSRNSSYDRRHSSNSTSSEGTKDKNSQRKESTRGKSISPQSETCSSEADGGDNETSVNPSGVWEKRGRSRTPRKLTITSNNDQNCDIASITTAKKLSTDRKSLTTAELMSDGCNAGDNHEIKGELSIHKSRSASLNVKKASEANKPTLTETASSLIRDVSPKFVYKEKVQRQNTIQSPAYKGVPEPLIASNIIAEVGNDTTSQRLIWEHESQAKSVCNKGTIKIDFENTCGIPDYKQSKGKSRKQKAFASSRPFGGLSSEPAPSEIEVGKNAYSSKRVRSKSGSKKRKVLRSTSPPKKTVGAKNMKPPAGVNTTTLVKKVVTPKKPDTLLDNRQSGVKALINAPKGVNPSAQINTNTPYIESDARNKLGPCGTLNDYDTTNKANPRPGIGTNNYAEKDAGKKTWFSDGNRPATYMKRDNTLPSGGLRSNPLQNDYEAVKKADQARGGAGVTSMNICGDNGAGMKIEPGAGIRTTTAYSKRDDTGPRGEVRSKPVPNDYGTGKKVNPCGGIGTTIYGEKDAGKKIGPGAGIRTSTAYTKRDDTGPCGEVRSKSLHNEHGTGKKANPCGGVGTSIYGEQDTRKKLGPSAGIRNTTTYTKRDDTGPCGEVRSNPLRNEYDKGRKANPCGGVGTTIYGEQDAGKKIGPCAGIRTTTGYTGPCGEVRSNPLRNEYDTGRKANPCGGIGTTSYGEQDAGKKIGPCAGIRTTTGYTGPCGEVRSNPLRNEYDTGRKANPCGGIGTTSYGEKDAGKKLGPCAGIRTTTAYTKRDDSGPCGEVRSNPLYNEYGTGRKTNPCGGVGTTICGEKDSAKKNWPCGGNLPSTAYMKNEGALPCGTARANSPLRGYDITTNANPCAGLNKKMF